MEFKLEWVIPTVSIIVSIIVAIIAVFFARRSVIIAKEALIITKEALEITRKTQRPFLNVVDNPRFRTYDNPNKSNTIRLIELDIINTGNYPADKFSVTCGVCIENKNSKLHELSPKKEDPAVPSILFPGEKISACFEEIGSDSSTVNIAQLDVLTVKVVISYKNKLSKENHKTVRGWLSAPIVWGSNNLMPSTDKDYWD